MDVALWNAHGATILAAPAAHIWNALFAAVSAAPAAHICAVPAVVLSVAHVASVGGPRRGHSWGEYMGYYLGQRNNSGYKIYFCLGYC